MTRLNDPYADLLTEHTDVKTQRCIADLASVCADAPPPALRAAMDRAMQARMSTVVWPAQPDRGWWIIPRRGDPWRPGLRALAVAGLLAAALATGGAIAATGLINQIISLLPGGADQHYAVTLNKGQSACGFTVTLKKAYADANRLIVAYDVTTPPSRSFRTAVLVGLTASDALGRPLAPLNSAGSGNFGGTGGTTVAEVQEFDTSGVRRATTLRVHLAAPHLSADESVPGQPAAAPSCERDGAVTRAYSGTPHRGVIVPGPFVFTITLPFSPQVRMLASHLSGTSRQGTTISLQRIVVTPTEARLYLRGPVDRFFIPLLVVGGKKLDVAMTTPVGQGAWVARFFPRPHGVRDHRAWLYDDHSTWTVKVLTDPANGPGRHTWGGSVNFKVQVP